MAILGWFIVAMVVFGLGMMLIFPDYFEDDDNEEVHDTLCE